MVARAAGPLRWMGFTGIAVCMAFYLLWEISRRSFVQYATSIYPIDPADEWRYTACSRLVAHGYSLFTQVFSAQPPLLFLSLAAGMRVAGETIGDERWVEIGFGAVALAATAWIAWTLAGPVAGMGAAAVLAVSPAFLVYSHAIEAEGPMMALSTLSIALVLQWRRTGGSWLAAAGGFALAGAVLMKLFAAEAIVPALWIILASGVRGRESRRAAAWFVGAALAPVVLDFLLIAPAQQWDQVISLHTKAAGSHLPNLTPPFQVLGRFYTLDLGLTLLAATSIVAVVIVGRWRDGVWLGLWVVGSTVMLLVFRPLFPHHPAILTAGLAVCGGVGVGIAVAEAGKRRWRATMPIALGALAYLLLVPRLAHDDRHVAVSGLPAAESQLASYVEARTTASDIVAVDDVAIADLAHRLVPPPLCDPSNVRLRAGYLTRATLVTATSHYRATLVMAEPGGIYQQVPGYVSWLKLHYRRVPAPDSVLVYRRPERVTIP